MSAGCGNKSRDEYLDRINRVLAHVLDHLDSDLTLASLADIACFSPWHFHRIFTALMGETPDDYVRRLRLEKAASRLIKQPDMSLTEIAGLCGFSTSALFSRNFAKHYGLSPSAFRSGGRKGLPYRKNRQEAGKDGQPDGKEGQQASNIGKAPLFLTRYHVERDERDAEGAESANVTTRRIETMRVAYLWHVHGYFRGVDAKVEKIVRWARARELVGPDTKIIGIGLDNPDITPEDKCRLLVCVTLPVGIDLKSLERNAGRTPVGFRDIPGGLYAVWSHRGSGYELTDEYYRFYRYWLPDSGFIPTDSEGFMTYTGRIGAVAHSEGFVVDVYIPIAPL